MREEEKRSPGVHGEEEKMRKAYSPLQVLRGCLLLPSLFHALGLQDQPMAWPLTKGPSSTSDAVSSGGPYHCQSAASPALPTRSHVSGLWIIMRPTASAPSPELCRWHTHITL